MKEVQLMVKRITALRETLNECETSAEDVEEQETLLGLEVSTSHMSHIKEIKTALEPIEKLWINAFEYLRLATEWNQAPLSSIDAEEAERKADELYRTLGKVVKELDKCGESGEVPKNAAQSLVGEIKTFLEEQIPLMLLLCNPGLKERHWQVVCMYPIDNHAAMPPQSYHHYPSPSSFFLLLYTGYHVHHFTRASYP